ncbi:uncharacterized protein LOC105182304 isoform X2 [Harpegnathos saltator]|uniref:uncharacterized protein LOC105182304 isoform X2 n=1 Tax=Harpegnathos saltator TaxID=610380 RepID=UPI00058F1F4C|nr:uncharacterized protein LOC105182304 isoform X2 [Harpegnathos saltator]
MDGDLTQINDISPVVSAPLGPQRRRPLRSDSLEVNDCSNNNSKGIDVQCIKDMSQQRQKLDHIDENDVLSDNSDHDKQTTDDSELQTDESDKEKELFHSTPKSRNCSTTFYSPESINNKSLKDSLKKSPPGKTEFQSSSSEQNTNNSFFSSPFSFVIIIILAISVYLVLSVTKSTKENKTEFISNKDLFKSIEDVKTKFYNQDSYIWNDISSGINEVKMRTPKVPSIILLFANETHTMDCLASALAHLSNNILGGDGLLNLNPKNFGDDPGEIIDALKKTSTQKAVIIRDVLNINTEAIKALHNLCDRINPLIREVIYIITMQTKNYESSQKKMAFVEKQIYHKLSKNIDEDILMALVTRITDGAIILVQPEPNLRYC